MLAVYTAFGPLAGILGIPYTLIVGNISLLFRVAMRIVDAGVKAAGIRVRVSGIQHVPAGQSCIFMCNHVSNLDPPVVMPYIPGRFSVLLKKSLMNIPILGTAMRMAQFVPVERAANRETAQTTVAAAAAALQSGLHILVFPEGTRSLDGRLAGFKKGPFFLAQQTAAPIIPVAISGTQHMMRKGSAAITPGTAHLQMLAPIFPADYPTREALTIAVRKALINALPEEMKPLLARA